MFDEKLGKTARMQKRDMSNRIKFVSEELGLKFEPNKTTSKIHKPVHQIKDEHKSKAVQQEKDNYNFREMQKKITSLEQLNSEQKKELHKLNSQVKNNKLEFEELNIKIAELEHKKTNLSAIKALNIKTSELRKKENIINDLTKQNNDLREELVEKTEKINSTQDLTLLRNENKELKTENLELKKENSRLSKVISIIRDFAQEHSKGFNELLTKIKNVFERVQELEKEKDQEHTPKTKAQKAVAQMVARQKRGNDYER